MPPALQLRYEHLPRESNTFADHAAGVASKLALEDDVTLLESYQQVSAGSHTVYLLPLPSLEGDRILTTSWTTNVVLKECAERGVATLLHAINLSLEKKKLARRYVASLVSAPAKEVTYSTRAGQRLYASGICAQTLPKEVRLFLFGRTHFEIDLIAAHFCLFVHATKGDTTFEGLTIPQLRKKMQDTLQDTRLGKAVADAAKTIINRFLNSGLSATLQYIRDHNFFVPFELERLLRNLDVSRSNLVTYAKAQGYVPGPVTDRNRYYYCMEYLEARFMKAFVSALLQYEHLTSVIWLHDGVWVAPEPSYDSIKKAIACATQGDYLPPVKITNLNEEWNRRFQVNMPVNWKPAGRRLKLQTPARTVDRGVCRKVIKQHVKQRTENRPAFCANSLEYGSRIYDYFLRKNIC